MTAKRWFVGNASLAVAAVLAAGCGDDEELVELTGEEAEALALEVGAVSSMAWLEKRGDGSGEYEFVVPCSASGSVTFSGASKLERNGRRFRSSFDVDGTQAYSDCANVVEGGETMTLSGTVVEVLSFNEGLEIGPTIIEIRGAWKGAVVWSRDSGDSGECEVDLALEGLFGWDAYGEEILGGRLDGRFCTLAVDAPWGEWYETP